MTRPSADDGAFVAVPSGRRDGRGRDPRSRPYACGSRRCGSPEATWRAASSAELLGGRRGWFRHRGGRGRASVPGTPSTPSGSADRAAQHLVAAADAEDGLAGAMVGEDVDVPARLAQGREIGDGRLGAGDDDEIGRAGAGVPGSTMTTLTPGSAASGSRSSKLAMRGRRGTAMVKVPARRAAACVEGQRRPRRADWRASANNGTGPEAGNARCARR